MARKRAPKQPPPTTEMIIAMHANPVALQAIQTTGLVPIAKDSFHRCRAFLVLAAPNVQIRMFDCLGTTKLLAMVYRNGRNDDPQAWKKAGEIRVILEGNKLPAELAELIKAAQAAAELAKMPAVYHGTITVADARATLPDWFVIDAPPAPIPSPDLVPQ
jgi:hypothetical protein